MVSQGQSRGQTYVPVTTAFPQHPSSKLEFYSDSTIDVQLNGFQGTALLDTGAAMSLIGIDLLARLIPNYKSIMSKFTPKYAGIVSVTGQKSPILGVLPLSFKIGDYDFVHYTHVVSKLGSQMILGRDFLQANNCTLNFANNSLRSSSPSKLYTPSAIHLPPRSITTFGVKMCGTHKWRPDGLVMQVSEMEIQPGVHTNPSLSKTENGYITTQVHNDTAHAVHLPKGQHISYATPCSGDTTALKVHVPPGAAPSDLAEFPTEADFRYGSYIANEPDPPTSSADHIKIPADTILSPAGQLKLRQILQDKHKAFVGTDGKIGTCSIFQLKLQLKPGAKPFRKKQYRMSPHVRAIADEQIKDFLAQGIIESCDSEYSSPLLVVTKGQKKSHKHVPQDESKQTYRIVTDLRELNSRLVNTTRLVPNIDDLIDSICHRYKDPNSKPKYFTSLDLKAAYHQCVLEKDSRHLTAFEWGNACYAWAKLPMGLNGASGVLVKTINKILAPFLGVSCLAYLDDILIISETEDQHLQDIHDILSAFEKANLLLHPDKCKFGMSHTEFLGLKFNSEGIRPSDKHLAAIRTYPRPRNVKEVRTFLGLINYFRKHIKDRAAIAAPLNNLTKKDHIFQWTPDCEASFQKLRQAMMEGPVLRYPRFSQRFYLATDASTVSVGGVLTQVDPVTKLHHAIGYCGRSLNKHERNYSITKLELLAVVYCVQYFRPYIEGVQFTLFTDHSALTSILNRKPVSPQIARFSLILQGFDYEIRHKAGNLNAAADSMSRRTYDHTTDETQQFIDDFPDNQVLGVPDTSPEALRHKTPVTLAAFNATQGPTKAVPVETVKQRNERKQQAGNITEYVNMSQPLQRLFSLTSKVTPRKHGLHLQSDTAASDSPSAVSGKHRVHFPLNPEAPIFTPIDVTQHKTSHNGNELSANPSLSSTYVSSVPLIPLSQDKCQLPPSSTGAAATPHYHTRSYTKQQASLQGQHPGILKHSSPSAPSPKTSQVLQDILKEFDTLCPSPKDDTKEEQLTAIHDAEQHLLGTRTTPAEDPVVHPAVDTGLSSEEHAMTPQDEEAISQDEEQMSQDEDVRSQEEEESVMSQDEDSLLTLEDDIGLSAQDDVEMPQDEEATLPSDAETDHTVEVDEEEPPQRPPERDTLLGDSEGDYIPADPTNLHIPRYNTRSRGVRLQPTRKQRLIKAELRRTLPQVEQQVINDTSLTAANIQTHQANDAFCKPLLQYLDKDILPDDPMAANTLLNIAPHYVTWNKILYAIHYYTKASDRDSKLKLVVPNSLVHAILLTLHTSNFGAHQGSTKTLLLAKEQFYWPRMAHDVAQFVGSCDKCLLYKRNQKRESPLMTLFQPTDAPFERLTFDFLGPLPMTPNKMRYIAIIVDHFSRYTIAFALPNKTAQGFAFKFYQNVISIFGAPRHIHSDNAPEFHGQVMADIVKYLGIKQTWTSGYTPHSNGLSEAHVKKVASGLRMIVNHNDTNWHQQLAAVLWAINTTPTSAHGHSPFLLLFGRLPRYPHSRLSKPDLNDPTLRSDVFKDILHTQELLYDYTKEQLAITSQRMKSYYDRNKKPSRIVPGSIVFIHTPVTQGEHGFKFSPFSDGPYLVTNVLERNNVTLKCLQTNKVYKHPIHVSRLKLASRYDPKLAFRDF